MAISQLQKHLNALTETVDGTVVKRHLDLTDRIALADRKYALSRLKKRVEEELAEIDAELKEELSEGEVIYGSEGIGYRLSIARQDQYDERVIQVLNEMDLLHHFAKVSTQRLLELVRSGHLSWDDFHALRTHAGVKEIPTLREVVSPEAAVF